MLTADRDHRFQEYRFQDLLTPAEGAAQLGKNWGNNLNNQRRSTRNEGFKF